MLNIDYISYNHASEKEHSTTSILIKSQITSQSLIDMISLRFHFNFFFGIDKIIPPQYIQYLLII